MAFRPYIADGTDPASHPAQASSQTHPLSSSFDWGSLLSSPLDPAVFAALDSNGALGVVKPPYPQSGSGSFAQSSLPSSSASASAHAHPLAHSAPHHRDSWPSTATPPYSPHLLSDSQRTSPSQSPQSAGALSHMRAARAGGVQGFPAGVVAAKQEAPGADRTRPEPKGFVNLQQVINRPPIAQRRSAQAGFGGGHMPGGMRLGMPPAQIPAHLGASSPSPLYPSSGERTHHMNLPPSLWMSPMRPPSSSVTPTQTAVHSSRTPPVSVSSSSATHPALLQLTMPAGYSETTPSSASSSRPSSSPFVSGSASTIPTSAASDVRSPTLYSDILAEEFLTTGSKKRAAAVAHFPSPTSPGRGSPDLATSALDSSDGDIEKMAEKDPLAAQVWRLYARTKANLPHAQRMENLTWRMMTLQLKKREEEARNRSSSITTQTGQNEQGVPPPSSESAPNAPKTAETGTSRAGSSKASVPQIKTEPESRGRRPDKTAARVRVVGFEGKNQDGEDEECV